MQRPQRHERRVGIRAAILLAAVALGALQAACARLQAFPRPGIPLARLQATPEACAGARLHGTLIVDYSAPVPGYAALSSDEKLDRSTSLPGIQGVVHGVIGDPTVRPFQDINVTDFPFTVDGFYGPSTSPYPSGKTITLRILGGCTPGLAFSYKGAPNLQPGEELFAFVRDVGEVGDGNTDSRLVAPEAGDVFEVRGGVVYGQGSWSGFAEPIADFKRHFQH